MLEITLSKAVILKKIVDAISGLAQEVNFDCSSSGVTVQVRYGFMASLSECTYTIIVGNGQCPCLPNCSASKV